MKVLQILIVTAIATPFALAGPKDEPTAPAPEVGNNTQAEAAETAPAAPAVEGELTARVLEMSGRVEWKPGIDEEFRPAEVGLVMGPGAWVRTGMPASAKLELGENAVINVKHLSKVAISELARTPDKVLKTTVVMPYGKMDFDIRKAGDTKNDFRIKTTGATLAMRGTSGNVTNYGGLPDVNSSGDNDERDINVGFNDGDESDLGPRDQLKNNKDPIQSRKDQQDPDKNLITDKQYQEGGGGGNYQGNEITRNLIDAFNGNQQQNDSEREREQRGNGDGGDGGNRPS